MTLPLKTRSAALAIGATVAQLRGAISNGKLDPPEKDASGDYLWTDEDLDRARAALAVDRRRKRPEAPAVA